MTEKAILAIEEALLANLFTQRAIIELLIKKGIIDRKDLEHEILHTETEHLGIGQKKEHVFLEKRTGIKRRQKNKKPTINRRKLSDRRKHK
jgi:hypothetical protein